jgi:hypothetical protein
MSIEISAANAVNDGQISTISKKQGQCTNPAQKARKIAAEGRKPSAHLAIKVKCWNCMGGEADTWDADTRRNIRECTCGPKSDFPCALHPYRPYR